MAVYNSAGELVKTIFTGGAEVFPGVLTVSTGILAPGTPVKIGIQGYFVEPGQVPVTSLNWDGTNDNGQKVAGGMYSIKLQVTDHWGDVTTLQQVIQALPQAPVTALLVFNSAGEEVTRLSPPSSWDGVAVNGMTLGQGSVVLDGQGPQGGSSQALKVTLHSAAGANADLSWNGLNALGRPVDPGVYTLELVTTAPNSIGVIIATRSIQVLKRGQDLLVGLQVAPQPWTPGKPLSVRFQPCPGLQVLARLYDVAGELVRQAWAPGDGGGMALEGGGLSTGIYLLELDLKQGGGTVDRVRTKVALLP